jgi:hypothetical protein
MNEKCRVSSDEWQRTKSKGQGEKKSVEYGVSSAKIKESDQ